MVDLSLNTDNDGRIGDAFDLTVGFEIERVQARFCICIREADRQCLLIFRRFNCDVGRLDFTRYVGRYKL